MKKSKFKIVNLFSNFLYLAFSLGLIGGILLSINLLDSVLLAIALVFVAKWRVFAVKPRFWLTNLKAAMIDYFVGFGFVYLVYLLTSEKLLFQVLTLAVYLFWLLAIKPKSDQRAMAFQSLIAVFLFNLVIFYVTSEVNLFLMIIIEFILGYSAAWHYLFNFDFDKKTKRLISGCLGYSFIVLFWLTWHWNISYGNVFQLIHVSQLAMISSLITYLLFVILEASYINKDDREVNIGKLIWPVVFVAGMIAMIIVGFSKIN